MNTNPDTTSPTTPRPLLTYEEVAIMCHVSVRTVSRWTTEKYGSLPCIKIGGVVRFLPEDVMAFLRKHRKERRVKRIEIG